MSPKKEFSDLFDENFEVTYEEDPGVTLDISQDRARGRKSSFSRNRRRDAFEEEDDYADDYDDDYSDDYDDAYDDSDDYDDEYDSHDYDPDDDKGRRRSSGGRRSRGGVPLAAPIKKGGKALSRITGILLRQLSAILIIATSVYVTYNFWRASTPYGDIIEAIEQREISQTLAAYFSVAAIFLLYEFISLLWTMTSVRVRNGRETWKEDTGRGFLSFILVFVSSYMSFLLVRFLPDSPEIIYGVKGALDVYGSLHNVLLGLCAAGAVSCLVRRYRSY